MADPRFNAFRALAKSLSPAWLRGKWGERFMYSIAIQFDALADALRDGIKLRMPGQNPSALPYLGADRVIERGYQESDDNYAGRLQRAFDDWSIAGSPISVIKQLLGYISPNIPRIRYVVNGYDGFADDYVATWITIEAGVVTMHRANPANWNWDGNFAELSRFWIIIYAASVSPPIWEGWEWGDGHFYGQPGLTWGGTATANQVRDIRRIIRKWKCAGSNCQNIIVCLNETPGQFDPTNAPGAPMPDGDWDVPSNRDATCIYWQGTV